MHRVDVAVIGAGPSGSWAAHLLARRGARVAIIDPSHPREKPCGGGVTGRALSLIAGALDGTLPTVAIRRARFVDTARGRSLDVPLDERAEQSLIVASRSAFDARLLAAAVGSGARPFPARATAVVRRRSHWEIRTSDGARLQADVLVGADGANSFTRRRVARAFRRDQLSVATGFFAHGVHADDIVIELTADPPGYIWSFPRPGHLAVGACAPAGAAGAAMLRARLTRWIEDTGIARGARLEPYAWPIPSLCERDLRAMELAGPGWMLLGDAAGLVDPITREGIFFALQSAVFAADALGDGLARPAHAAYRDRVCAEIGSELVRAARFKAHFFRPRFIGVLLEGLDRSERIRRVMADLIAGRQSYRDLKWRLARTFELGLAVSALAALTGRSTRRAPEPAHPAV